MSDKKYEIEIVREIWPPNGDGWRFEVGQDRDGLGRVAIRVREKNGAVPSEVVMDPEAAKTIASALLAAAEEIQAKGEADGS